MCHQTKLRRMYTPPFKERCHRKCRKIGETGAKFMLNYSKSKHGNLYVSVWLVLLPWLYVVLYKCTYTSSFWVGCSTNWAWPIICYCLRSQHCSLRLVQGKMRWLWLYVYLCMYVGATSWCSSVLRFLSGKYIIWWDRKMFVVHKHLNIILCNLIHGKMQYSLYGYFEECRTRMAPFYWPSWRL